MAADLEQEENDRIESERATRLEEQNREADDYANEADDLGDYDLESEHDDDDPEDEDDEGDEW